jgi:hypothetical protein
MYQSMLMSEAYKDLTHRQVRLLICCLSRSYGHAAAGGVAGRFTLTKAVWGGEHGLYNGNRDQHFREDMQSLIRHGFIDCVEDHSKDRVPHIYRYSDRWHYWGTSTFALPITVMTDAMRRGGDEL